MKHHRLRSRLSQNELKKSIAQPPIKTISLFLSNLDEHIHDSFQKVRKDRQKDNTHHQAEGLSQYQSHYREDSSLKQYSTLDGASKLMYNSQRKQQGSDSHMLHSKQQDTTVQYLDNQEVNEYIQLVYDMYNIPDPLEGTQPPKRKQKISIHTSRRTSPSLRKKGSASSFKEKMIKQRDIDLGPFHSSRKPNQQKDKQTEVDISLLSTIQKPRPTFGQRPKVVKLKRIDAIPNTSPMVTNALNRSPSQLSGRFTSQTFRYCFACEATVLEANLKYHESECIPLQQALKKDIGQVLAMLDSKITRLSREIRRNFIEGDSQNFMRQYLRLKNSVGEWLETISQLNKQNYRQNAAREKMAQMSSGWGQTISTHCESISKLHWFSRMRQNMRKSYHI